MNPLPCRRTMALAVACVTLLVSAWQGSEAQISEPHELASSSLPEAPGPQNAAPSEPPPDTSAKPATSADQPASSAKAPISTQVDPDEVRKQQREQAERDLAAEKKQRLLGIMPQFQTVLGGKAVPLSAGEKWNLASHTAIDPFYIGYGFIVGGGYSELQDSHTGYGHGTAGYFKRVGANYADNIDGALIGNGLLPILLHQDPRYFRLGTGSFRHRFFHAELSTVVCLGDNGHLQANVSNIAGNFISGAISNAYYPADERGLELTLENGLEVTALGAIGGQLLEFGPDINRLLHHHKKSAASAPGFATQQP